MKKKILTLGAAVILSISSTFAVFADDIINGNTVINGQVNIDADQAKQIAIEYWKYKQGETDSDNGFAKNIVEDGIKEYNGKSYYVYCLRWLVDNEHWSTIDWLYVSADTGETYSNLNEIPTGESTTVKSEENTATTEENSTTMVENNFTTVDKEQQTSSLNNNKEETSKLSNAANISDNNNSIKTPKTGDFSLIEIFLIFSIVAVSSFVSLFVKKRKV